MIWRAVLVLLLAASAQAQPDFWPVVLTGEDMPRLLGAMPDEVAAFAVRIPFVLLPLEAS